MCTEIHAMQCDRNNAVSVCHHACPTALHSRQGAVAGAEVYQAAQQSSPSQLAVIHVEVKGAKQGAGV